MGDVSRESWNLTDGGSPAANARDRYEAPLPPISEDYFEWINLLEAVFAARGRFVMFELGAGYGSWGVRGALAARQRGIEDIEICFVEAEPQHAAWLRESIALNGLADKKMTVIEAAVSGKDGEVDFYTGHPQTWYGQRIVDDRPIEFARHGLTDAVLIRVPSLSLRTLLREVERVDLIDMDIQGAELDVVTSGIDVLNDKVRRLHIETHSAEIDQRMRPFLVKHGWYALAEYPCFAPADTPYGTVDFVGGHQSWVNPRLR
jgi:FkbM family methyltransferase